jgi:hypothetical protein
MNKEEFEKMFPEGAALLNKTNVYLDNNMFDAIEKGMVDLSLIDRIVGDKNYRIGFSDAHIHEVNTMTGYDSKTKSEVVERRLNTIAQVTKGVYYNRNDRGFLFLPGISPQKKYEELKSEFMTKQQIVEGFQRNMSDEKRKEFRNYFGFEALELNGLAKDKVLHFIRDKMAAKGVSMADEMKEYLGRFPKTPHNRIHLPIVYYYLKLVLSGYFPEQKKKPEYNPDIPTMWDGEHISSAAYCDHFISRDMRCCEKAKVIYTYLRTIPSTKIGRITLNK